MKFENEIETKLFCLSYTYTQKEMNNVYYK